MRLRGRCAGNVFEPVAEGDKECPVCFTDYTECEDGLVLHANGCRQVFNVDCIQRLYADKYDLVTVTCPVCSAKAPRWEKLDDQWRVTGEYFVPTVRARDGPRMPAYDFPEDTWLTEQVQRGEEIGDAWVTWDGERFTGPIWRQLTRALHNMEGLFYSLFRDPMRPDTMEVRNRAFRHGVCFVTSDDSGRWPRFEVRGMLDVMHEVLIVLRVQSISGRARLFVYGRVTQVHSGQSAEADYHGNFLYTFASSRSEGRDVTDVLQRPEAAGPPAWDNLQQESTPSRGSVMNVWLSDNHQRYNGRVWERATSVLRAVENLVRVQLLHFEGFRGTSRVVRYSATYNNEIKVACSTGPEPLVVATASLDRHHDVHISFQVESEQGQKYLYVSGEVSTNQYNSELPEASFYGELMGLPVDYENLRYHFPNE